MTRAPKKRRGRILSTLFVVLVLVGLLPLALVAWKLIETSRKSLETAQQQQLMLLASGVADEVDVRVDAMKGQLASLAQVIGGLLQRGGPGNEDRVEELVRDARNEHVVYVRVAGLHGPIADSANGEPTPEVFEKLFLSGFAKVAEKLKDERAVTATSVVTSSPVLLPTQPPVAAVVLTAPIVAGGRFRGAVFAVAEVSGLWEEIVANRSTTGYALFAVDERGRLWASSNLLGASPGDSMIRSAIVGRFVQKPEKVTERFLWSEGGAPESHLGSCDVTREGWGVFVQAKERQAYASINRMIEETLRWALLAVSLALLAAIVLAGTLSKPINRLAEAARSLQGGDFSARVDVRSRNEIGELADIFNTMAGEIEGLIHRLQKAAEENNELFLGTARALAGAIDAKDPYTHGHSERVNRYSVILARHCELSPEEIRDIHVASLLHDVGKIGVDDAILKKPAPLTVEEFEVMKRHTTLGAQIMSPIRKMRNMIPGLRSHHERWQGGGYPDGLGGEQIPFMARIIAVADSFDAMTTDRPYQSAMSFEAAVARLNQLKGTAFDERVVEAFNRAYLAGEIAAPGVSRAQERVAAV